MLPLLRSRAARPEVVGLRRDDADLAIDTVTAWLKQSGRNAADTCGGSAQPELDSLLPASLNLPFTWSLRNTTAAMTARAMSATRRMYSTIEAPRSSLANFASSHVRNT